MFSVEDVAEPGELDSRGMLAPGSSVCVFRTAVEITSDLCLAGRKKRSMDLLPFEGPCLLYVPGNDE